MTYLPGEVISDDFNLSSAIFGYWVHQKNWDNSCCFGFFPPILE